MEEVTERVVQVSAVEQGLVTELSRNWCELQQERGCEGDVLRELKGVPIRVSSFACM